MQHLALPETAHVMGMSTAVPYQRTPLFRQISRCPTLRPATTSGAPQQVLTAYCMVLTGLDRLNPAYVRLPETWQAPHTGDIRVLVHDFVRHTLVRYPVPAFMYKVWDNDNDIHKQWFIHLGAGKNLRKAEGLPFDRPMTKMHAHHFCAAPSWMTIDQALRYGQVRAMDGSTRLAKWIATSCIGAGIDPASEPFWIAAIRELLADKKLTGTTVRAVIQHWYQLFFMPQFKYTANGRKKLVVPDEHLNPLLRTCLPDVLAQIRPNPAFIGLNTQEIVNLESPFPKMNDSWKRKVSGSRVLSGYEIRQIRTSRELVQEGQKMNHCVGSYVWRCRRGYTYIFSFQNARRPFQQSCLTIEVSRGMRMIQVKGPSNRQPSSDEKKVVMAWASLAGIRPDCGDLK